MNGILLVDKPAGWTSHDVVAKARSLAKQAAGQKVKVGHAGTLDPFATGLLIVLIGSYTKRASEFLKLDKTYEVTCRLGETSTTGDPEGEVKVVSSEQPQLSQITTVLGSFIGEIMQAPPIYSAMKIGGQRAYKLARAGKAVKLEPRKVRIYSIQDTKYSYPKLSFTTKVTSGTYIRSLVEDIGQALGTGAYCTALRRQSIGSLELKNAVGMDQLSPALLGPSLLMA